MKKYFKVLLVTIGLCVLGTLMVLAANSEQKMIKGAEMYKNMVSDTVLENVVLHVEDQPDAAALILYEKDKAASVKYEKNLRAVLNAMKIRSVSADINDAGCEVFENYDMIALATGDWESALKPSLAPMISYVAQGGRLLAGTLPVSLGEGFHLMSEMLGMETVNGYTTFSQLNFEREHAPGMNGMAFSGDSFTDSCLDVELAAHCEITISGDSESGRVPIAWTAKYGQGTVSVYNGTAICGDYWRGVLCGCINGLFETTLYPVINASCLFIDDFPSPQYESESDITMEQYNRSVKEFYRDIWWPEMQIASRHFEDIYTGLFIATYNDIVDPERFEYTQPAMEQYYGNSLLLSGHEMGAHGYNHQSLTLQGGTPEELGYVSWEDPEDMKKSLEMLNRITGELFPYVEFKTYVPPSNYLSAEGRQAVKEALPDLKVISGLLTDEESEGDVCVSDFGTGEDGIINFPRITSGMVLEDYGMFSAANGFAAYGVFSHFIHPDDWMDPLRSKGYTWEEMYDFYCESRGILKDAYPFIRPLAASEAADAVNVWEMMDPRIVIEDDYIYGSIENFCGEAFFYLKTDKNPQSVDDSCDIRTVDRRHDGCYYFVTIDRANFKIKLV